MTIPNFDLTTAVVLTSDAKLIARFQEHCVVIRETAAQWCFEQATEEKRKVEFVQHELAKMNHALPQSDRLLADAQKKLDQAKLHWDTLLYSEAYREARAALRPLRILMRRGEPAAEINGPLVEVSTCRVRFPACKRWFSALSS